MSNMEDEWVHRPPGKKNTRKWCKGKVGREHTPEIVVPVNAYTRSVRRNQACHEIGWWDQAEKVWHRDGQWSCAQALVCSTCQKVIKPMVDDCPDRPPHIPLFRWWWQR